MDDELKSHLESKIQSIRDVSQDVTLNMLVYGPPGVGKTYSIRTIPGDILLASSESGLASISDLDVEDRDIDVLPVDGFDDFKGIMGYLSTESHDYNWLVCDSLTEIAETLLRELKEESPEDTHGMQIYGDLGEQMMKVVKFIRDLDLSTYMICRQSYENTDEGMKYLPSMPGKKLTHTNPIGHEFDFQLPLRAETNEDGEIRRFFQTESTGKYQARKRDPQCNLERMEPADVKHIISKANFL